jgi:hypothetical protein
MSLLVLFGIHLLSVGRLLDYTCNWSLFFPACLISTTSLSTSTAFTFAKHWSYHYHHHRHSYRQQLFSLESQDPPTMFNFIATQGAARVTSMFGDDESVVSTVDTSSTDDQDTRMYNSIFSADVVLQDASVSNGILNGTNIFLQIWIHQWMDG